MKLSQKENVQTVMPGGVIHFNTNAVTGGMTCNELQKMNFDLMLFSCVGVSTEGAFEASLETAQIKQTALFHSKRRILVADETKFNLTANYYRTASLGELNFIATNADDKTVAPIRAAGVTVYNKI